MVISLCFALLSLPLCAAPQEPKHHLMRAIDIPLLHMAGVLSMQGYMSYLSLPDEEVAQKSPWTWDRSWTGQYSRTAAEWSDHLLYGGLAFPLLWWGEWATGRIERQEFLADAVILAEVLVLNSALNNLVRGVELWARPLYFSHEAPEKERLSDQARSSFYSGHASSSFALATAVVIFNSSRERPLVPTLPLAVGVYGTATAISALRVAAGKHYPTDVVAGAAVGSLVGWAIPKLHEVPAEGEGRGLRGYLRRKELKIIPYPSGIIVTWRVGGTTPQSEIW